MRMAGVRDWLWRLAMLLGALVALFFLWFTITPFDTVGDPAFDIPHIRAQAWSKGPFLIQCLGVLVWLLCAMTAGRWGRGLKCLAAAILLFLCLLAMGNEYAALIQNGELRDPYPIAEHKLMVSRLLTLGLALASLVCGGLALPRR